MLSFNGTTLVKVVIAILDKTSTLMTLMLDFAIWSYAYCKVARSRLFWLVAHLRIFRLFMKGKFNANVL